MEEKLRESIRKLKEECNKIDKGRKKYRAQFAYLKIMGLDNGSAEIVTGLLQLDLIPYTKPC